MRGFWRHKFGKNTGLESYSEGLGKRRNFGSLKDFTCSKNPHLAVRGWHQIRDLIVAWRILLAVEIFIQLLELLASERGRVLKSRECNFNWKFSVCFVSSACVIFWCVIFVLDWKISISFVIDGWLKFCLSPRLISRFDWLKLVLGIYTEESLRKLIKSCRVWRKRKFKIRNLNGLLCLSTKLYLQMRFKNNNNNNNVI